MRRHWRTAVSALMFLGLVVLLQCAACAKPKPAPMITNEVAEPAPFCVPMRLRFPNGAVVYWRACTDQAWACEWAWTLADEHGAAAGVVELGVCTDD